MGSRRPNARVLIRTPIGACKRVVTDVKCLDAAFERVDSGRDILGRKDFRSYCFEAKRGGRCLNLAHIQCGGRITALGHNSQTAQTRDNVAQQLKSLVGSVGLLQRQASGIAARPRENSTTPAPTGSPADANTIGMTDVACFAATVGGVADVTMTFTLRRTNSAANSAR